MTTFLGRLTSFSRKNRSGKLDPVLKLAPRRNDSNFQSQIQLLLDSMELSSLSDAENGYPLYNSIGSKQIIMIDSLCDMVIEAEYYNINKIFVQRVDEKNVLLKGCNSNARLLLPVITDGSYIMAGTLNPKALSMAISSLVEQYTLESGIFFTEQRTGNSRILFNFDDLSAGPTWITSDGAITIKKLRKENLIQFKISAPKIIPNEDTENNIKSTSKIPTGVLTDKKSNLVITPKKKISKKRGRRLSWSKSSKASGVIETLKSEDFLLNNAEAFKNASLPDALSLSALKPTKKSLPISELPSPKKAIPLPPAIPSAPPAPSPTNQKRRRVRKLNWNTIPANKLENTFWSETADKSPVKGSSPEIEEEMLSLFSLSPVKGKKSKKPTKKKNLTILDVKRTNNTSIILSQFKISPVQIKDAIFNFDDELVSAEQLLSLQFLFPMTDTERNLICNYTGEPENLCVSDRFYFEMCKVPDIEKRISFFLLKLEFNEDIERINHGIHTISTACKELKSSPKFAKLLRRILRLGSYLDKSSRITTSGFTLQSLVTLSDTRSAKNKSLSFLDYVVSVLNREDKDVMKFYDDLPTCLPASQCTMKSISMMIEEISGKFGNLEQEIMGYNSEIEGDDFVNTMSPFYREKVTILNSINQEWENTQELYQNTRNYYGDDSSMAPEEFFSNVYTFIQSFKKAENTLHQRSGRRMRRRSVT
eukprot:TRINITY_DN6993_c0_g1_i1.p1 TRINITY_DN6993_c0_g1~~TRINITY_DN6993_c0_g1_i1.p1  ORF type:complete len:707 (-),score=117.79 TRINITY_DN6993_c0_g1_i1:86-2206(-)